MSACDMLGFWGKIKCGKPAHYEADGKCSSCGENWTAYVCLDHAAELRSDLSGCLDCQTATVGLVALSTLGSEVTL